MGLNRITADVGWLCDELLRLRLTRLKQLYDMRLITEAMYYQKQCEIFTDRRERTTTERTTVRNVIPVKVLRINFG